MKPGTSFHFVCVLQSCHQERHHGDKVWSTTPRNYSLFTLYYFYLILSEYVYYIFFCMILCEIRNLISLCKYSAVFVIIKQIKSFECILTIFIYFINSKHTKIKKKKSLQVFRFIYFPLYNYRSVTHSAAEQIWTC